MQRYSNFFLLLSDYHSFFSLFFASKSLCAQPTCFGSGSLKSWHSACLWAQTHLTSFQVHSHKRPQDLPNNTHLTMNTPLALYAHPSCDTLDLVHGEQSWSVFTETFRHSNQPWDKSASIRESDTTQSMEILACPYSSLALDDHRVSMMLIHLEVITTTDNNR